MFSILVTKRNLEKKFLLNNICKNEIETHLVRNFIKDLTKCNKDNIDKTFEDFFLCRAISFNTSNYVLDNIKSLYNLIKKEFNSKNKSNLNFYLVKESDVNHEIITYWFMDLI